ncbi:hypothetical protein F2Q68_00035155 [Brassica cretica]|uniref:Uncharacterized protein n=1 Tax=Brassica cretica TaxID=69181 RepID=A0A8S9HBQ4_BRACR|nr:hypothetical protein F2Q68_00035155 [Brassica cretica]
MNMARTRLIHRFISPPYLFPSLSNRVVVEQACLRPGRLQRALPLDSVFLHCCRFISFSPPICSTAWARILAPESAPLRNFELEVEIIFPLDLVWLLSVREWEGRDGFYGSPAVRCFWSKESSALIGVIGSRFVESGSSFFHVFKERLSTPLQWPRAWLPHLRFSCSRFLIWFSICSLLVDGSLVLVGLRGFLSGCAHVLIPVFDEACDGSSSNNFSSSVLIGYGRVVVLVSLTATSNIWFSLTSQLYIEVVSSFALFKRSLHEDQEIRFGSCFGGSGQRLDESELVLTSFYPFLLKLFPEIKSNN